MAAVVEQRGMRQSVADRVAADTDDVLATIHLVRGNERLVRHLFAQLTDLLLESIVVGLREDVEAGRITDDAFTDELAALAAQCTAVGLLSPAQ